MSKPKQSIQTPKSNLLFPKEGSKRILEAMPVSSEANSQIDDIISALEQNSKSTIPVDMGLEEIKEDEIQINESQFNTQNNIHNDTNNISPPNQGGTYQKNEEELDINEINLDEVFRSNKNTSSNFNSNTNSPIFDNNENINTNMKINIGVNDNENENENIYKDDEILKMLEMNNMFSQKMSLPVNIPHLISHTFSNQPNLSMSVIVPETENKHKNQKAGNDLTIHNNSFSLNTTSHKTEAKNNNMRLSTESVNNISICCSNINEGVNHIPNQNNTNIINPSNNNNFNLNEFKNTFSKFITFFEEKCNEIDKLKEEVYTLKSCNNSNLSYPYPPQPYLGIENNKHSMIDFDTTIIEERRNLSSDVGRKSQIDFNEEDVNFILSQFNLSEAEVEENNKNKQYTNKPKPPQMIVVNNNMLVDLSPDNTYGDKNKNINEEDVNPRMIADDEFDNFLKNKGKVNKIISDSNGFMTGKALSNQKNKKETNNNIEEDEALFNMNDINDDDFDTLMKAVKGGKNIPNFGGNNEFLPAGSGKGKGKTKGNNVNNSKPEVNKENLLINDDEFDNFLKAQKEGKNNIKMNDPTIGFSSGKDIKSIPITHNMNNIEEKDDAPLNMNDIEDDDFDNMMKAIKNKTHKNSNNNFIEKNEFMTGKAVIKGEKIQRSSFEDINNNIEYNKTNDNKALGESKDKDNKPIDVKLIEDDEFDKFLNNKKKKPFKTNIAPTANIVKNSNKNIITNKPFVKPNQIKAVKEPVKKSDLLLDLEKEALVRNAITDKAKLKTVVGYEIENIISNKNKPITTSKEDHTNKRTYSEHLKDLTQNSKKEITSDGPPVKKMKGFKICNSKNEISQNQKKSNVINNTKNIPIIEDNNYYITNIDRCEFLCLCINLHHINDDYTTTTTNNNTCEICNNTYKININNFDKAFIYYRLTTHNLITDAIPMEWYTYQYKYLCWKYYFISKAFNNKELFTLTKIFENLNKKYILIYQQAKRSFLTKAVENDASINRNMILLLMNITQNNTIYTLELSDGYKSVYSEITQANPIYNLCVKNLIYPGLKLNIGLAKKEKMDEKGNCFITIYYNALSKAELTSKLGICRKMFLIKNLANIREDGGEISMVDVVILKKYDYYVKDFSTKENYARLKFEKIIEDSLEMNNNYYSQDYDKSKSESKIKPQLNILKSSGENNKNLSNKSSIDLNPKKQVPINKDSLRYVFKIVCADSLLYLNFMNEISTKPIEESEFNTGLKKNLKLKLHKKCIIEISVKNKEIYDELIEGNRYQLTLFNNKNTNKDSFKTLKLTAYDSLKFKQIKLALNKRDTNYEYMLNNISSSLQISRIDLDISEYLIEKQFDYSKIINEEFSFLGVYLTTAKILKDTYLFLANKNKNLVLVKLHNENFYDFTAFNKCNNNNKVIIYIKNVNFGIVYYYDSSAVVPYKAQVYDKNYNNKNVIIYMETGCFTSIKVNGFGGSSGNGNDSYKNFKKMIAEESTSTSTIIYDNELLEEIIKSLSK